MVQSMGSQRVRNDGVTELKFIPTLFYSWRRQWHPTPVLLPGESHGLEEPGGLQSMGSLELDKTE